MLDSRQTPTWGLGPGATAVKAFNDRVAPAGTRFSYASTEAQVLGLVLRAATDQPVAEYLQSKIWQEIGTEAEATRLIDNSGQESTYTGLNAVLRDYARLGLLLAHDGNWQGRQLIPASWVVDATTVRADQPHLRPEQRTHLWVRLRDVDPSRRPPDVHALGRPRTADLRRSPEQARHGEHRCPQAALRPRSGRGRPRSLVRAHPSTRTLTS